MHDLTVMEVFDPQNLSNLAWSQTVSGVTEVFVTDLAIAEVSRKIHAFSSQELANAD